MVARRTLMNKCGLFERDPGLLVQYDVKAEVDSNVFGLLVQEIEHGDIMITQRNYRPLLQLCEELDFKELREKIARFQQTIAPCDQGADDIKGKVSALEEALSRHEREREQLRVEFAGLLPHNFVSEVKQELANLRKALGNTEQEISKLRNGQAAVVAQVDGLAATSTRLSEELSQIRTDKSKAAKAQRDATAERKSLSAAIEKLKADLAVEPTCFPFRRQRYTDYLARQVTPPCGQVFARPPDECPGLDVDFDITPVPDKSAESQGPFEFTFNYPVQPVFMEVEKGQGTYLWIYIDGTRRRNLDYKPLTSEGPGRKSSSILKWPCRFVSLKIQCCTSLEKEARASVAYLRLGFIANPPETYSE
jgi:predicted  nucleic acid-binding Zn-ribbon protein